ncbi:MAG: RDD family protein, partial [Phenylobacterium sp.]
MATDDTAGAGGDLFWPRLIAAAIDVALFVVLANLLAVALYAASDGKLRSSTLMSVTRCAPLQSISPKALEGVALPLSFRATAANLCVRSLLGVETARSLTIGLQAQEGEMTKSLAISRPVNRANLPVTPVILDWTYPLGLILLLAILEWVFGRTPGKLIMRLKVSALDGRRLPPHRALLR